MMDKLSFLPPVDDPAILETRSVLKKLTSARAALAELKGISSTIPNQQILIDTLSLQEAKDSSAIENIVTTQDEIYQSNYERDTFSSAPAKEVHRYAEALKRGFVQVRDEGIIRLNLILEIQKIIEQNDAGIRKLPGTVLKNDNTGHTVYTPPQDYDVITGLLNNLFDFTNGMVHFDVDPLVKMAMIHYQFESIHPFYDGNGRTGRILNILFLIKEGLLDLPVLYISRHIIQTRAAYYHLLQHSRETSDWERWILYMLETVEKTALETVTVITGIKSLMQDYKKRIRGKFPKMYSQDLINNLFRHPYTKISWLENDLSVSRLTARKYLEILVKEELLDKIRVGRNNYYINPELMKLLKSDRIL